MANQFKAIRLPEDLTLHLAPIYLDDASDAEEIADLIEDLTDDLQSLKDEFPADFEIVMGATDIKAAAANHLAYLLAALNN